MFRLILIIFAIINVAHTDSILEKLRSQIELGKAVEKDPVLPYICSMLPSEEFIKEADDEDFLSTMLYELGFGLLGLRPDSWAVKFKADPSKPATCFSAFYSAATSELKKSTLAISRRLLARCCDTKNDL